MMNVLMNEGWLAVRPTIDSFGLHEPTFGIAADLDASGDGGHVCRVPGENETAPPIRPCCIGSPYNRLGCDGAAFEWMLGEPLRWSLRNQARAALRTGTQFSGGAPVVSETTRR
jgi:hypothetical protein